MQEKLISCLQPIDFDYFKSLYFISTTAICIFMGAVAVIWNHYESKYRLKNWKKYHRGDYEF